jgi:hypothetical protein
VDLRSGHFIRVCYCITADPQVPWNMLIGGLYFQEQF